MGTACAPAVANIYMATEFEAAARSRALTWPQYYFRLIDDGFFIWENDQASLGVFMQLLSTLLPNIRLKFQSSTSKLPYLDVWIEKDFSREQSGCVPIMFFFFFFFYGRPGGLSQADGPMLPHTPSTLKEAYVALLPPSLLKYFWQ